jgi:hypothetical protein
MAGANKTNMQAKNRLNTPDLSSSPLALQVAYDERFLRYMVFFYSARNRQMNLPIRVTTSIRRKTAAGVTKKVKIVR